MDRAQAHALVDRLFDQLEEKAKALQTGGPTVGEANTPAPVAQVTVQAETKRELPKDKRVVRTKSSGDRVYLLDEIKHQRQWVANPEVLAGLGFEMGDVAEVEDSELLKYGMGAPIQRLTTDAAPSA